MVKGLVKLIVVVAGIAAFFAALANIAIYLETSQKFPEVTKKMSDLVTSDTLFFIYRSLILVAGALAVWWISERLRMGERFAEELKCRILKLEGMKEPYTELRPDEVIHPSPDGVLWKWDAQLGADGPFCPRHRERLFHNNWLTQIQTENFDESFLGNTWWFTCPKDQEDFKFPDIHHARVKDLRTQASARLSKKA